MVWPNDDDIVELSAFEPGREEGGYAYMEIPAAQHLFHAEPLGSGRYVVLTHDLCPDKKYFHKCLHARAVDNGNYLMGEVATMRTKEWIRDWFVRRVADYELWILRSHMYIPPVVMSVGLSKSGGAALGIVHEFSVGENLLWARGFATHERRWFALLEDEEGKFAFAASSGSRRPLHWLASDTEVLAFEWVDGGLALLFAPQLESGGTGRPRVARLDESGELEAKPRKIARGEPLPAPFADRIEAVLERRGKDLVFRRQNAAGDPIGDPAVVAPFPRGGRDDPRLALGWTGSRFVAVWSSFEEKRWKVHSAAISCGETSPPAGGIRPGGAN